MICCKLHSIHHRYLNRFWHIKSSIFLWNRWNLCKFAPNWNKFESWKSILTSFTLWFFLSWFHAKIAKVLPKNDDSTMLEIIQFLPENKNLEILVFLKRNIFTEWKLGNFLSHTFDLTEKIRLILTLWTLNYVNFHTVRNLA